MKTNYELGKTIVEAMRLRDVMRADGASPAALDAAMLQTVKTAWPAIVGEDDRRCSCGDTGAILHRCPGHQRCPVSRHARHGPHSYLTPCSCGEGGRYRPLERRGEDVTAAGRPRRGLTRVGR